MLPVEMRLRCNYGNGNGWQVSGPMGQDLDERLEAATLVAAEPPAVSSISALYQKHFRKLVSDLTSAFGLGPPDPEDVAQRTFEQLLKRGDIANVLSLEAFLWRAAKNNRLSQLRSMASAKRRDSALETLFLGSPGYLESPERVLETRERIKLTLAAMDAMPSARRKAFEMVRFDDMAHKDVAKIMGISRPAVSKHVAKAMRDIVRALEAEDAADGS